MTIKQEELAEKHGTPEAFRKAIEKARDDLFITRAEAAQAMFEYQHEWNAAGQETWDCFLLMDPKTKEPVCVARHEDELEACGIQRGISNTEYKKRRLYVARGAFTLGVS